MRDPKKLSGVAKKTFEALSSYTFVHGGESVQRYLARVSAIEEGVLEKAIRPVNIDGMKGFCYDIQQELGLLTRLYLQNSAHIQYYTSFKPKDQAQKGRSMDLEYSAQMPQKVPDASSSSQT